MKDIAHKAGVSQATVSFILNGRDQEKGISSATRQRVLDAAGDLGYRPNQIARDMVAGKTRTIGFITWDLDPVSSRLLSGALQEANDLGYQIKAILLVTEREGSDDWINRCHAHLRSCVEQRMAGIVSVFMPEEIIDYMERETTQYGLPVTILDSGFPHPWATHVRSDDERGCFLAIEHLVNLRHKRIALIDGLQGQGSTVLREQGYRDAMQKFGLNVPDNFVHYVQWDGSDAAPRIQQLLDNSAERPTAIFCASDNIASVALRTLRQMGLSIPGDISVVGYGNSLPVALADPPLTTIAQPFSEMGRAAIRHIIGAHKGEKNMSKNGLSHQQALESSTHIGSTEVLPTEIIVRESTARLTK